MAITVNRGMYLEEIINNTCQKYYGSREIMIFKRELPIKIIRFVDQHTVRAHLLNNALVDYYGLYHGRYFEFEAKQVNGSKFVLANIKKHQFHHLQKIDHAHGLAFFVIYFMKYEKCYLTKFSFLAKIWNKKKILDYSWFQQYTTSVAIVFPGYLDLLSSLSNIFSSL